MSSLHIQPWGVLLISMANNMTYENKGDIHLHHSTTPRRGPFARSPSLSLPLQHGSGMGSRSLHQGQICLWWFGYQGCVQPLPLHFPSQFRAYSKINCVDRHSGSWHHLSTFGSILVRCRYGTMMKGTINWIVIKSLINRIIPWLHYLIVHSVFLEGIINNAADCFSFSGDQISMILGFRGYKNLMLWISSRPAISPEGCSMQQPRNKTDQLD